MRFIGIDIASENHVMAIVDEDGNVLVRPKVFKETSEGHELLLELAGEPGDVLVAMEATGHYWRNVFARLASAGFQIALLNPLRTRRFAEEDMLRAKTDEIDALSIARFAAQKKPRVTSVDDELTEELRELVLLRDRMKQDFDDRTRQLHRALDLSFPNSPITSGTSPAARQRHSWLVGRRLAPSAKRRSPRSPSSSTTAVAGSARSSLVPSDGMPSARSGPTKARPTPFRLSTSAKTSMSCESV